MRPTIHGHSRLRGLAAGCLALVLAMPVGQSLALDPKKSVTQFLHRKWTAADGVGAVNSIAQTPDGYLWLATSNGMFRYDGTAIKRWEPPVGDPALPIQLTHLLVARDGTLWFGADQAVYRLFDGHFKTYGPQEAFLGNGLASVCQEHDGTILAKTASSLSRFENGHWEKIDPAGSHPAIMRPAGYVDKQRNLWAFFFPKGRGNLTFQPRGETRNLPVAGDWGEGSAMVDSPDIRLRINPGKHGGTSAALFDQDGGLWICSYGRGLRRVADLKTIEANGLREPTDGMDEFTERDGLSSDVALSISEDREGTIWVGTSRGLDCFCETKITAISAREGLPFDQQLVVRAAADGSVWIGGAPGGFAQLRPGATRWTNREWFGVPLPPKSVEAASAICADPSGDLYLGTGFGVLRVHNDVGELIQDPDVNRLRAIAAIVLDEKERHIIGDLNSGLNQWDGKKAVPLGLHVPNVQRLRRVSAVYHTRRRGGLWVASLEGGLFGVVGNDPGNFYQFSKSDGLFDGVVRQIFEDTKGKIWVAGAGGLSRLQGNRFQTLDHRHGLPDDNIYDAIVDKDGDFWLAGGTGIFRVSHRELDRVLAAGSGTLQGQYFTSSDGLRGTPGFREWGGNGATKTPDGKLWFATNTGLAVIDPNHLAFNRIPPRVSIQSIKVGDKSYATTGNLVFPANARNCEFHYVGLSFIDPGKVRFRYRLEGVDRDWVDAEKRREAFYSNLRPGIYRFHVTACNNDGVWSQTGAEVAFSIPPAFYETTWFLTLCLFPVAFGLWGWHLLRLARLTRRLNQQLEVQHQERKRIAQELHDTLLQGFTGISLKLQAIATRLPDSMASTRDHLSTILNDSDRYLTEARRAVWALRSPDLVESHDFATVLSESCRRLVENTGIAFDFSVGGSAQLLAAEIEENLLRIGQEATANAVKHAAPQRVTVRLVFDEHEVQLTVSDNGCGFDAMEVAKKASHFGLSGIRERAEALNGTVTIKAQPGRGTEIVATIKIGNAVERADGSSKSS